MGEVQAKHQIRRSSCLGKAEDVPLRHRTLHRKRTQGCTRAAADKLKGSWIPRPNGTKPSRSKSNQSIPANNCAWTDMACSCRCRLYT